MSWKDIDTDDYIFFLCDWKTRTEIGEHFKLTNVESWHCAKFLNKLAEVQCIRGKGLRNRSTMYKARLFAIEEILEKKQLQKEIQEGENNENIFSNTDNK